MAAGRLEADLAAERAGNEVFEHHRVHGRDAQGRRLAGTPTPYEPPEVPAGKVNVTDPDSKLIKAYEGYVQGYNAQAVVDESQIVLAAEITNATVDWSQLAPMVAATWPSSRGRARAAGSRPHSRTPSTGTSSTWTRSPPTSTCRC